MAPVGDLWRRQGARLAYEVPVYERFLDIVAVQEQTRVVAIELKIRDWRKALQQAVVAQLVADEVYIAIWHRHTTSVDRSLLAKTGVGLISVDGLTAEILVSAQPSQITMADHRNAIMAWVKPPYSDRTQHTIGSAPLEIEEE